MIFSPFLFWRAPAGAEGRAAARRVAFLRKKLRKNLFGKRFFVAQWDRCEHKPPMPEGARPVFAGAKTVSGGRFFGEPIYLWAG